MAELSSGQFSRCAGEALVRHYLYFEVMSDEWRVTRKRRSQNIGRREFHALAENFHANKLPQDLRGSKKAMFSVYFTGLNTWHCQC
jgi:hypothetical protein